MGEVIQKQKCKNPKGTHITYSQNHQPEQVTFPDYLKGYEGKARKDRSFLREGIGEINQRGRCENTENLICILLLEMFFEKNMQIIFSYHHLKINHMHKYLNTHKTKVMQLVSPFTWSLLPSSSYIDYKCVSWFNLLSRAGRM